MLAFVVLQITLFPWSVFAADVNYHESSCHQNVVGSEARDCGTDSEASLLQQMAFDIHHTFVLRRRPIDVLRAYRSVQGHRAETRTMCDQHESSRDLV